MPSPFPGMDPYLESPHLWPDVHHELISQIRTTLAPCLRPHYVARVELRSYFMDADDPGLELIIPDVRIEESGAHVAKKPKATNGTAIAVAEPEAVPFLFDDEIKEARLEVRHLDSKALVAIIEVLSPANKIRGSRGRQSFMDKRRDTVGSEIHWIEIDLLRGRVPLGQAAGQ